MRGVAIVPAVAALVVLVACSPDARETNAVDSAASAIVEVDRAAEERAIRTLGERHARAVADRDTARLGEIFADDVIYIPQDDSVREGRAEARGAWLRGLAAKDVTIEYQPQKLEVSDGGDMAYERGIVKITTKRRDIPIGGNYLYVWRKRQGEWKVAVWMWSTDVPGARRRS